MPVNVTQPTTVPEFQRLATAFISGSRFPAGAQVYVVMSRSGLRPITKIIEVGSPNDEQNVAAAMANPIAQQGQPDMVTYQVTVPEGVNRLNKVIFGVHGWSGCRFFTHREGSHAPPGDAVLGRITSTSLYVTWDDDSVSIYDFPPETDAIGFTRGAAELFAFTVYQAMYGDDHVQSFKAGLPQ